MFLVHDHNRILVPMSMRNKVLQWCQLLQVHPGKKKLEKTIRFINTLKGIKADTKRVCKHCRNVCQMSKNTGRNFFA